MVRCRDRDPRRTGVWKVVMDGEREGRGQLTFHIDSLFLAEGSAQLLHFGGKTTLGVSSGERVMLHGVGPGRRKRVIGGGCEDANALDQGLTSSEVLRDG